MMRKLFPVFVGFLTLLVSLRGICAWADEKPIRAGELNTRGVLGDLGHPLGTVVTVEGVVADENYRMRKEDGGETLLRIQKVNGKALKNEVVFRFRCFRFVEVKKPAAGSKFRYVGYETGEYTGIPPEALKAARVVVQTKGYAFETSFLVLRAEKPGE
jgi:hypothetical protein